jgi:CheY-like chemotaxis protein
MDSRKHKLSIALPSMPVWLQADPTRMEQILTNLLNNAAKYTEPEGNIWLVAEHDPDKDQVIIRVRDSGIGIAPEQLATIFDLFIQVDHAQDRKHGGLGIGLTLVRRLVEMHGGSIAVHSDGVGQGSEFTLRLPTLAKAPWMNEQILPDAETAMRRHRRILIVEDNVDSAKSLGELLEIWGHDIFIAYDGPTAIEEAGKYHPDVILLDIGLPGMNGYQVTQELRQKNDLATALIIAVTGYGQTEDKERSKQAGIDYHITKPIDFGTLEELLS